jgi:hypothetical protein
MLDKIDEIPELPCLHARLTAVVPGPDAGRSAEDWLKSWNDREGYWTNLRNIEHWLSRAREAPT